MIGLLQRVKTASVRVEGELIARIDHGLLVLVGVNLATFFLFFTVNTPDDMARMNIGGKRVTQDADCVVSSLG